MSLTTPLALLLLPVAIWFTWRVRPWRRLDPWRSRVALALRLAIILLLTLALAGAQAVRATGDKAVVFLLDLSDSITPQQREQGEAYIRAALTGMAPDDQAAVVVFGAHALVDRPITPLQTLAPITSRPPSLQTDISEAIRLGLALFPPGSGRRLVLLSDGGETSGDSLEAARLAAAAGVPIDHVLLLPETPPAEAWLARVTAPERVREGERFSITVSAESTTVQPALLRVLAGGQILSEQAVQLNAGVTAFAIPVQAGSAGFNRYSVELLPAQDTWPRNNRLAAFTQILGAPHVLVVAAEESADTPDEAAPLIRALSAAGLTTTRITPAQLPADLPGLTGYAAIVLVNVNAREIPPHKLVLLQSRVRDFGGGLVAVGGPRSFGMGGWFQTPLEEMLPVRMQIDDSERFPPVSMVIVIDRSGSMSAVEGGVTKIQLAAEGAIRTAELLKDNDEIAIITVDTRVDTQIGPLPASERETISAELRRLGAGGGGIYVRTGLEAAITALRDMSNAVQHVIVLADGADAEEKQGVEALLAQLTAANVTVSMVAIGQGRDVPWLEQMANLGNGRFHLTDQAANIAEIFTQEATIIQRNYLVEERFFPTLGGNSPILSGISSVPPLYGYIATAPKQTAQQILLTPQGDPLLAQWQYGLGRTVAWTSDASGRWGREWVQWPAFATFWSQAVRWSMPPEQPGSVEMQFRESGGSTHLLVDVRDANGRLQNGLRLEAALAGPDGQTRTLALTQTGPGRYSGSFVPETEGAWLVQVQGGSQDGSQDGGTLVGQTAGWVLGYSPEYRAPGGDPALPVRLAALTGGRDVGEDAALPFTLPTPAGRAIRPIWHWLTLVAVLLLPFDIAVRRVVVTRREVDRLLARLRLVTAREESAENLPHTPSPQARQLLDARERARRRYQDHAPGESAENNPAPPVTPPAAPPPAISPPPTAQTPLAGRLLQKKRHRDQS